MEGEMVHQGPDGYVKYLLCSLDLCLKASERGARNISGEDAHPAVAAVVRLAEAHERMHDLSRQLSLRLLQLSKDGIPLSQDAEATRLWGILATMTSVPPWR